MSNPTDIFISISFKHRNRQKSVIAALQEAVLSCGFKPYVFVNQYRLKDNNYGRMMKDAFSKLKNSRLLIAELSHQSIGVGIEIGYAKAIKIPIIYIHNKQSPLSTTAFGTSDTYIQYTGVIDLKKKLTPVLASIK